MKNFLVQLKTKANKAYPTPVVEVVPGQAGDIKTRTLALETEERNSALEMSENCKSEQIKRFSIMSMLNWFKPKL